MAAQVVAEKLWRISAQYGFHPVKDKLSNEHTRLEFSARVERMIVSLNLMQVTEMVLPRHTFENALVRTERDPVTRGITVSLAQINELALIWACKLLDLRYRGLDQAAGLDVLKTEVAWLLERFAYRTPNQHALLCPGLTDWRDHETLWRAVRDYNAQKKFDTPIVQAKRPAMCETCVIAKGSARS